MVKRRGNEVIILRGPTGSGKTTWGELFIADANNLVSAILVSANHYFENNGEYLFDGNQIKEAHESCFDKFSEAIEKDVNLIIVDNTNSEFWEYKKYIDLAKDNFYKVRIIDFKWRDSKDLETFFNRSIHDVPQENFLKMCKRHKEDSNAISAVEF